MLDRNEVVLSAIRATDEDGRCGDGGCGRGLGIVIIGRIGLGGALIVALAARLLAVVALALLTLLWAVISSVEEDPGVGGESKGEQGHDCEREDFLHGTHSFGLVLSAIPRTLHLHSIIGRHDLATPKMLFCRNLFVSKHLKIT